MSVLHITSSVCQSAGLHAKALVLTRLENAEAMKLARPRPICGSYVCHFTFLWLRLYIRMTKLRDAMVM